MTALEAETTDTGSTASDESGQRRHEDGEFLEVFWENFGMILVVLG